MGIGSVPNTFQNQVGPIPLSELDEDFEYVSGKVPSVEDFADAGNDSQRIQAAIDYAAGIGGMTIDLEPRIYNLTFPVTLKSGVFLRGSSMRSTQLNSPAGAYAILAPTCVRSGVERMFLNGAGPGYGMYISDVSTQVTLNNVWFESSVVGLQINNGYFIGLNSCSFQSCDTGIAAQIGANLVNLNTCQFHNASNVNAIGIDFQAELYGWCIKGGSFEAYQPVYIRSLASAIELGGVVFENVLGTALDSAIVIGGFSGGAITPKGVVIKGCTFAQNINYGITLKSSEGEDISGNYFYNKLYAIKVQNFDAPRRFIRLGANTLDINLMGYDFSKYILYDGAYGDSLSCNLTDDTFGFVLHGVKGVPTAALENGEAALFQTDAAPAAGLVANKTYLASKTAGVVSNKLFVSALSGSTGWTPGVIANGASVATPIPVLGVVGTGNEPTVCSFSLDLLGCSISGYTNAANQAVAVIDNATGAPVNLGAGTISAYVFK